MDRAVKSQQSQLAATLAEADSTCMGVCSSDWEKLELASKKPDRPDSGGEGIRWEVSEQLTDFALPAGMGELDEAEVDMMEETDDDSDMVVVGGDMTEEDVVAECAPVRIPPEPVMGLCVVVSWRK